MSFLILTIVYFNSNYRLSENDRLLMKHNKDGGLMQVTSNNKAAISNLGAYGKKHGFTVEKLFDFFLVITKGDPFVRALPVREESCNWN